MMKSTYISIIASVLILLIYQNCSPSHSSNESTAQSFSVESVYPYFNQKPTYFDNVQLTKAYEEDSIWKYQYVASIVYIDDPQQYIDIEIKIYDENKYVYLYDSLNGVNVFDYYGALKNNILITHWQNFKVAGKYIFGSQSDTLYRYNVTDFMYDEWKMPAAIADCRSFNFTTARVYALKENELKIYSINQ